jgi:thioredoxin
MKKVLALLILSFAIANGEEIAKANSSDHQPAGNSAGVIDLRGSHYDETLQSSNIPVVVDIHAKWCGACKMVSPLIDELNAEYNGRVLFAKVDVDTDPSFIQRYNVTGMPTILFFKPGNMHPVYRHVGYLPKPEFEQKINEYLLK